MVTSCLRGEGFALLVVPEHFHLHAERLPLARIGAALQVIGRDDRVRHLDELVGVEVEVGKDRVEAVGVLACVVALQERIGRARHARNVARVDEAFRAQRLGVANE